MIFAQVVILYFRLRLEITLNGFGKLLEGDFGTRSSPDKILGIEFEVILIPWLGIMLVI